MPEQPPFEGEPQELIVAVGETAQLGPPNEDRGSEASDEDSDRTQQERPREPETSSDESPFGALEISIAGYTAIAGLAGFALSNVYVFHISEGRKDVRTENRLRQQILKAQRAESSQPHNDLTKAQQAKLHTMIETTPQEPDLATNAERLGLFMGGIIIAPILLTVITSRLHKLAMRKFGMR